MHWDTCQLLPASIISDQNIIIYYCMFDINVNLGHRVVEHVMCLMLAVAIIVLGMLQEREHASRGYCDACGHQQCLGSVIIAL